MATPKQQLHLYPAGMDDADESDGYNDASALTTAYITGCRAPRHRYQAF
jgi:hypothetical protein